MANVLVFAETRGTALRKVALEAVAAARALADASGGGEVHAVVAGPPASSPSMIIATPKALFSRMQRPIMST